MTMSFVDVLNGIIRTVLLPLITWESIRIVGVLIKGGIWQGYSDRGRVAVIRTVIRVFIGIGVSTCIQEAESFPPYRMSSDEA